MSGPSNALIPSNQPGGPTFAQQGSVDWVSLSNSTLGFSVEILSRFSKAGVEMITVAVGQAIFSTFVVPSAGQKRVTDAVAKLKVFSSYGNVLWFGFGIKHVVRTLCETEQGATCAAMCACLSVSYDLSLSSQVLKALTDEFTTPGTLTPALSQWGSLLRVCAGAVADSQFATLVEVFSRLVVGTTSDRKSRPLYTATTAKSLAGALRELSKVSNGTLRSVTFEGGVDCGWLAAVAQWLLCLRIEIYNESGSCVYSSITRSDLYAQVIIRQHSEAVKNSRGATAVSKSYFVRPGNLCFTFTVKHRNIEDIPLAHFFSCGRSEWDHILRDTFAGTMDILLLPQNVGKLAEFFCSGFQPTDDPTIIEMETLDPWGSPISDRYPSRRQAFLKFAARQLPELAGVLQVAEQDQGRLYNTSFKTKQFSPALTDMCHCNRCSNSSVKEETRFCLPKVAAIIYQFLWILSWLDIDKGIKPSSSGLLTLYYTISTPSTSPISLRRFHWTPLQKTLLSLFTGSDYSERLAEGVSAVSDSGISIYHASLEEPNVDPSRLLRYRVVLGQIEWNGCTYQQVSDRVREGRTNSDTDDLFELMLMAGPTIQLTLVVEETLDARTIEADFQVETTHLVLPQQSGQFVHNCVGRDRQEIKPSGWYAGAAQMRHKAVKMMRINQCCHRHLSFAHSDGFWNGECSMAWSAFNDSEKAPRQGEWLLSQAPRLSLSDNCCTVLLRGDYILLYSMLCAGSNIDSDPHLAFVGRCLICSIQPYVSTAVRFRGLPDNWVADMVVPAITVCSMVDVIPIIYELASSVVWKEEQEENSSAVTSEGTPDPQNDG